MHKTKGKSPHPEPSPTGKAGFDAVKQRINQQRRNGRFVEYDQKRAEQLAEAERLILEQVEADQRPITDRVSEHVLEYDDSGNLIGVKPAR